MCLGGGGCLHACVCVCGGGREGGCGHVGVCVCACVRGHVCERVGNHAMCASRIQLLAAAPLDPLVFVNPGNSLRCAETSERASETGSQGSSAGRGESAKHSFLNTLLNFVKF